MEIKNLLDLKNRKELRQWFIENSKKEKEFWVILKRGKPVNNFDFWYIDAVEEALCFGWIDTTTKKTNKGTAQRFMPRRKNSNWTELNKERCRRLENLGLMTPTGREILPEMNKNSFKIDDEIIERIKKDKKILENYNKFPELYNRIKIDNIQSVKKDRELYLYRLEKYLQKTRDGKLFGQWNDYGRLV